MWLPLARECAMAHEVVEAGQRVAGVPEGRVTVLRRSDCSHGELAITTIKRLADELRIRVQVDEILLETDQQARARGCLGSPTILVGGRDVDPEARGKTEFGVT
jgi:hypothetical protein